MSETNAEFLARISVTPISRNADGSYVGQMPTDDFLRLINIAIAHQETNGDENIVTATRQLREKLAAHQALIEELRESKDSAYNERDRLVALLASLFPSWLTRHPDDDEAWEDDWRWIVGIELPAGQATWHIHDSELPLFAHVERRDVAWDGHSTEEKYERVSRAALQRAEVMGGEK